MLKKNTSTIYKQTVPFLDAILDFYIYTKCVPSGVYTRWYFQNVPFMRKLQNEILKRKKANLNYVLNFLTVLVTPKGASNLILQ